MSTTSRSGRLGSFALAAMALMTLSACGSSMAADAPDDATLEDFCRLVDDGDRPASDVAADFAEVGTPSGITDAERNGFEVYVDALDDKGDEPYREAAADLKVPEGDVEDGNAFITFMSTTCKEFMMESQNPGEDNDGLPEG